MRKFLSNTLVWLATPSAGQCSAHAQAHAWPDKPVRIIVGYPPGAARQAFVEFNCAEAAKFARIAKAGSIHAV